MTTPTFNLKDLSDAVADKFNLTRQGGSDVTQFILDTIKSELASGKQVRLHRFGTFEARKREAGVARNPHTGEKITVPARRVVKLTVSPALKELL